MTPGGTPPPGVAAAPPFDLLDPAVLSGRSLIESSAGTGKTYTIAALFVRLLVERRLRVGQILVVTYTKAATEELKDRIRRRIREAIEVLAGRAEGDDFLAAWSAKLGGGEERAEASALLSEALRSFDEAAIFTIHGFCQRVLKDNAFESASFFDTELETDDRELFAAVAEDHYRRLLYDGTLSRLRAEKLLDAGYSPETVAAFLRENGSNPYLTLLPDPSAPPPGGKGFDEAEAAFRDAFAACRATWTSEREAILGPLSDPDRMSQNSYRASTIVPRMAERMDALLSGEPLFFPPVDDLARFAPERIEKGTKKGQAPPDHPFHGEVGRLLAALAEMERAFTASFLPALRREIVEYGRAELSRRKRERNVRLYDDLLQDLHRALLPGVEGGGSGRNDALVSSVRSRYAAALIDEFQDTDLLQYRIFTTLFPESSTLFLIGDPKQAIYGFRGADIFAYLEAVRDVRGRWSLDRNHRSTARLVEAVDLLFRRRPGAFVFPGITAPKVGAGKNAERVLSRDGVAEEAPLKFHLLPPTGRVDKEGNPVPWNKEEGAELSARSAATAIVSLLEEGRQGRTLVDDVPVAPAHVAVLVRTNGQALRMQDELRRRGVPAVVYGTGSVFDTKEARELQLLLEALADPGSDGKIRAALATSIFGLAADDLFALREDEGGWSSWARRFLRWRDRWGTDGFIGVARAVLSAGRSRSVLLARPGGERSLTNLLQLLELAHGADHEGNLGVEGLRRWLARVRYEAGRDGGRKAADEHQLRLETDDAAVKVVTVHKSKGLEYPVVFCPFPWDAYGPKTEGRATTGREGRA